MTSVEERPETTRLALRLEGITKRFGTTLALDSVTMEVNEGEVRALLGRNGAGKSTLIAVVTGLLTPEEGTLQFPSAELDQLRPEQRVACVYQKSTLVPYLTAAENVVLDAYPKNRLGLVDWKAARERARSLLDEWGAAEIVDVLVEDLDLLQRKIVEICRALGTGARILLLDEPTAGLDGDATRTLFERMSELTRQGFTIIYVSHYLEEVFEVCNTVTIVRDGRVVMTDSLAGLKVVDLVDAMVGEVLAEREDDIPVLAGADPGDAPLLAVTELGVEGAVEDFAVQIRPGECVGLVGLEGSGIFDVARAIAGLQPRSGTVTVHGRSVPAGNVMQAIREGIGFLPEDRHESGFVPEMANEENATLSILHRLKNRAGFIRPSARRSAYATLSDAWEIKQASFTQTTKELSGGNQQKVALARAFASKPDVLVLSNPTAGVDVSAKASIAESIAHRVATDRTACLIVSTDESEFQPCSRVLILYRGRLIGELTSPWTEHQLAAAVQGDLTPGSNPSDEQPMESR
ncbi:sugar ABC transporter ATP-binding protein [Micromonospora sp. DT81.3]|uniref:sugar ABC transporter ATP-binding protein n=1 Tax=Micromonospora sp. DT81.3 TaxID=3416523 RepID=UPI003CFB7AC9